MATLPSELIELIITFLKDAGTSKNKPSPFGRHGQTTKLAQYAVISRQWQAIVEQIIWQKISVVKPDSFKKLQHLTSGDSYRHARVGYIRHILWLPYVKWHDFIAKTRGDEEAYAALLPGWHHEQYLSSISNMFRLLDSWKNQLSNVSLSLWLSDSDYLGFEEIEQEELESLTIDQLWKRSQIPHLLHLTASDFQDMPTLPFVKSFQLHDPEETTVRPSAFFHILNCLPHVKHVSFGECRHIPLNALEALCEQRKEVTDSLPLVPESVERFTYYIATHRELSLNPACDAANYLSPNGLDEFSSTFRTFSMRLREVHLENVRVSSAIFWPETEEDIDKTTLYWPNLEILKILEVPPYTPDGKWILDNDPTKYSDLEEDSFHLWEYDSDYYAKRGFIKCYEVDKLYGAIGRAAQRMPRLQKLKFSFRGEIGEAGSNEYLRLARDLTTGQTRLEISTEWEYELGEGVISAWGLEGEKADDFRDTWSVMLDQWPCF